MMRVSTQVWSGLVAGVLLVGLPSGVTLLDGVAIAQTGGDYMAQMEQLWEEGKQLLVSENYQAALEVAQEMIAISENINDPRGVILGQYVQGVAYSGLGELDRAYEILQSVINSSSQIGLVALEEGARNTLRKIEVSIALTEANRLFQQGIQQFQTSQFRAALQSLEQALALYREIGDRQGEGASLGNLGIIYDSLGQFQRAIAFHEQHREIAREIGDRQGEANSLNNLGRAYYSQGQYEQAIAFHEQSLDITREIRDRQGEAKSLGNLGQVYYSQGQYEQAIVFHEQSLEIKREIGDRGGEAASLGNLGLAYFSLDQYERAIAFHEQHRDIAQEIGDRGEEAASLGNLGLVYYSQGQYQRAIAFYEQTLEIAREIGNRRGETASLGNLGNVYDALGQYQRAIAFHEQSLDITQEIGDRQGEAKSLGNLGNVYFSLGQYEQAITLSEQQREIAQEIGDWQGEANSLGNLGNVYSSLGHYEQAIAFHEQSLEIKREIGDLQGEANSLGNLGLAYSSLGEYERAIAFHEQYRDIARKIGDRQGEATSLGNLGIAYDALGQYQRAIAFHEQAFDIAQEIGDRGGEGSSLNNLGVALLTVNRAPEAEQQLLAAAKVYESIRADLGENDANKISIFEQQSTTYRALQLAQIAQNKTFAALETAERGRARAFVELLHRRLNPDDPNATIQPPNLAQIQQIAKEQNATLVEYSIIGEESALYIWVIAPSGDITFRQVDLTSLWRDDNLRLDDLVKCTRDSLGVRGLNLRTLNRLVAVLPRNESRRQCFDDDFLLPKLHEILIAPIADLLPTNPEERVVFLPQSSLFLVPFPALIDANGDYLIEKHTILTAPSIQTLQLTRDQKNKGRNGNGALIVGNPTMPSVAPEFGAEPQPLTSLPGAEREAIEIADLLNTDAITGDAASKTKMVAQMQNAEIIHLATHGLLDDIRGIGSAIAFAPDANFQPQPGETNGLLTAEEIFDMDLKADLVVLSACDTGRGRITGDGVVGLSRSFVSAGVPSVLVSLWAVPDAPTAELMTEFYRQRAATGDNAQALRQAMLQTMRTHPEPRNWAAFTLIGKAD
jgi:CHAT domain-containing protein/Tfp pilus assembly protein PilF